MVLDELREERLQGFTGYPPSEARGRAPA